MELLLLLMQWFPNKVVMGYVCLSRRNVKHCVFPNKITKHSDRVLTYLNSSVQLVTDK